MKTLDAKTKAEIAERRKRIASLCLLRMDQSDIAAAIGCSQPTVSRDIAFLTNVWKKEAQSDIEDVLARELAELNQMELEAAKNYVKSKQNEKPGDSMKWLDLRLSIKDRRVKLLGIDKLTAMAIKKMQDKEKTSDDKINELKTAILSSINKTE